MEDSTQGWTQLGPFFQNRGTFFRISKMGRGGLLPPPPQLHACSTIDNIHENQFTIVVLNKIVVLYLLQFFVILEQVNTTNRRFSNMSVVGLLIYLYSFIWCWQLVFLKRNDSRGYVSQVRWHTSACKQKNLQYSIFFLYQLLPVCHNCTQIYRVIQTGCKQIGQFLYTQYLLLNLNNHLSSTNKFVSKMCSLLL